MKRGMVISIVLLVAVLVAGCLDYKAYDVPKAEPAEDKSLVDEIAAVEKELTKERVGETAEEEAVGNGVTGAAVGVLEEKGAAPAGESIQEEAAGEEAAAEEEVVEEVVLPELSEEPAEEESAAEADLLPAITVKENELVKLHVNISDPDNDPVTYTFSKPLDRNGEWKTNYGDAGEYVVTIAASDGKLTSEQKLKIVVERVNVPPVISPLKDITVNEGDTVTFKPVVSDPNKDQIEVAVSGPLEEGTFETDHTSAGEYTIKVVASDGELETTLSFKLTVNNVNVLPVITNLENIKVKEGEVVRIEPIVTDLDEDPIVVKISEPVGDDGVWETGYTSHGTFDVTVTADDGKDKVTKQIKVTVEDVNMPPRIGDVRLG